MGQTNWPPSGVVSWADSLLLLNLHGEALHVGVLEVKAEVLPAEAQILGHEVRRRRLGRGGARGHRPDISHWRLGGGGGGKIAIRGRGRAEQEYLQRGIGDGSVK